MKTDYAIGDEVVQLIGDTFQVTVMVKDVKHCLEGKSILSVQKKYAKVIETPVQRLIAVKYSWWSINTTQPLLRNVVFRGKSAHFIDDEGKYKSARGYTFYEYNEETFNKLQAMKKEYRELDAKFSEVGHSLTELSRRR